MNMGEQQKLLERLRKAVDDRHTYHIQGGQHRHDGDFAEELIKQFFNMTVEHSVPNLEAVAEDGIALGIQIANLEGQLVDAARKEKGLMSECRDVEQYLGQALNYPWYKDDQKNFPDCTDADGVCVGEHTPSTIAAEAAKKLVEQQAKINELTNINNANEGLQQMLDQARTAFEEAREAQISIMDFDYPPVAQQGAPTHEVLELLTANDVNAWIQRIETLTDANAELQLMMDNKSIELETTEAELTKIEEHLAAQLRDEQRMHVYRARRISQVENCVRWALRKLVFSRNNPLVPTVADRANAMYDHLFPPQATPGRNDEYPYANTVRTATHIYQDEAGALEYVTNLDGSVPRRR